MWELLKIANAAGVPPVLIVLGMWAVFEMRRVLRHVDEMAGRLEKVETKMVEWTAIRRAMTPRETPRAKGY